MDPFLVFLISIVIHVIVFGGSLALPGLFGPAAPQELPFEALTVQLVGSLEPPAPAAPSMPVDEKLAGPDVVELPSAPPALPQPTPLEEITIPAAPIDVIPIGIDPTPPPPKVEMVKDPPPKVTVPEPEPPKPKPKPKAPPKTAASTDSKIAELRRKRELEEADLLMREKVANLNAARGRGNGQSSVQDGGSSFGAVIDPVKSSYYQQVRSIVRSNWLPPATTLSPDLTATFVIVISPSGRVTARNMRTTSGSPEFDQAVEMAIARSVFPPLPDVFGGRPDNPALQFSVSFLNS
jgi:outer membrane biosynthesis protein TonB